MIAPWTHPSTLASARLRRRRRRRSRTDHTHRPGHGAHGAHGAHGVHLRLRIATVEAARRLTTTRTARAIAGADLAPGHRVATAPRRRRPALPNGDGQALYHAAAAGALAGIHAVVGGEVAADHKGFCRGAVAGQRRGFVGHVGAVLAIVDADFAEVAQAGLVGLVERRGPVSALAEACLGVSLVAWLFLLVKVVRLFEGVYESLQG